MLLYTSILILLVSLVVVCREARKHVFDIQLRKRIRISFKLITLSLSLCITFVALNLLDIDGDSCQYQFIYPGATITAGCVGLAVFADIIIRLFKQGSLHAARLLLGACACFVLLVVQASAFASFCIP